MLHRPVFQATHLTASQNKAKLPFSKQVAKSFACSGDVKVAHNAALNQYFANACANPEILLNKLSKRYDRAIKEQEKKERKKFGKEEVREDSKWKDGGLQVLRYNKALLCVQLQHYGQARQLLDSLFENIEMIDDFLAIKICFLLLELCLLQRAPEQGLHVLHFLENSKALHGLLKPERPRTSHVDMGEEGHFGGQEWAVELEASTALAVQRLEHPALEKQESHGMPPKPLPSLVFGGFLPEHGRAPTKISLAEFKFNCLAYRIRINVALGHLSSAKRDCKKALELLQRELQHEPILWPHKWTNDTCMEKDHVRHMLTSHERAIVSMLKAFVECARGNFQKTLGLMSGCCFNFAVAEGSMDVSLAAHAKADGIVEDKHGWDFHPAQDDACCPVFFNNMGCMHFMMQKPNLAIYYFQKALAKPKTHIPARHGGDLLSARMGLDEPGFAASRHWLDKGSEIAFNIGLQLLLTGRSAQASRYLERCIPFWRTWPRLWIRLAECCIESHRQSKTEKVMRTEGTCQGTRTPGPVASGGSLCDSLGPTASGSGVSRLAWGVRGFGIHRRLLLMVDKKKVVGDSDVVEEGRSGPTETGESPAVTSDDTISDPLLAATMCLKNVLLLIERGLCADSDRDSQQAPGLVQRGPCETKEMEANLLEDAALLKLSWISLCQHDHVSALRYSKRLLDKNNLLMAWTFQCQNLPHPKDKGASPAKWSSSIGSIACAVSYVAEALWMGGRVAEAHHLLMTFGDKSIGKGLQLQAQQVHSEPLESADVKKYLSTPLGGLTPPVYLKSCGAPTPERDHEVKRDEKGKGKEAAFSILVNYERASFLQLGDMQSMILTNFAAVLAQLGNFKEARGACEKALKIQPTALLPLTLAYLDKCQRPQEAMKHVREGLD